MSCLDKHSGSLLVFNNQRIFSRSDAGADDDDADAVYEIFDRKVDLRMVKNNKRQYSW